MLEMFFTPMAGGELPLHIISYVKWGKMSNTGPDSFAFLASHFWETGLFLSHTSVRYSVWSDFLKHCEAQGIL